MITAAVIAATIAVLPAAPVEAAPLMTVHVTGEFRYVWDQPAGVSPWYHTVGLESWELRPKDAVEVRRGGVCIVNGVAHRSTSTQSAICYGVGLNPKVMSA